MPKFNHVMLDLETLSLRSDACIVQIAAVAFDIETGELGPRFNAYVNESCLVGAKVGHIDVSTVGFWMRQKFAPTLGASITDEDEQRNLYDALGEFDQWFANLAEDTCEAGASSVVETAEEISLWSHGAGFDIPILAEAYNRALIGEVPWHYRAPRDTRTLFAVAPGGMPKPPKAEAREHDAQYDCEYQLTQVVEAWKAIRDARDGGYESWRRGQEKARLAREAGTHVDEQGGTHSSPEAAVPAVVGYSGMLGDFSYGLDPATCATLRRV